MGKGGDDQWMGRGYQSSRCYGRFLHSSYKGVKVNGQDNSHQGELKELLYGKGGNFLSSFSYEEREQEKQGQERPVKGHCEIIHGGISDEEMAF